MNCDFCQNTYDESDSDAIAFDHFCSRDCERDQAREDDDRRNYHPSDTWEEHRGER